MLTCRISVCHGLAVVGLERHFNPTVYGLLEADLLAGEIDTFVSHLATAANASFLFRVRRCGLSTLADMAVEV